MLHEYLKNFLERGPWLRHVFADRGCVGPKLKGAIQKIGAFTQEIGLISGEDFPLLAGVAEDADRCILDCQSGSLHIFTPLRSASDDAGATS
ncbi:hypothetical protein EN828_32750 [Mesorhizobium sp. M2D.F.Ca.ET.185.01.1.1]|nr:hypothetical protein EJ071_34710 [Mesorhizobium sp. M1B.F.Ca.ET.045.04.1.1]RUW42770.1 hypothetical protein EOA37_03460 [Mesorhizobium sp. M2A.F.Ca.ET.015.02.1.1]RUW55844.1 hypothetical protein EOA36_07045 [Mesorhizobium sp. M8A.F.Ca.ET.021.01.1.1]RVC95299.1 hypothetical protein EN739_13605 [Mesorhizobium sp. M2A.F.Ca.ET.017.03.2.1]RVD10665.1 hypothetical protein EN753_05510 [Mesorhizobium sp. M2A.F.Ca.ET.029.05.1.1]RVD43986.1 hypothetical protein EN741_08715 [Mesorhizobium sp. M4B.F.Ca.ET.0